MRRATAIALVSFAAAILSKAGAFAEPGPADHSPSPLRSFASTNRLTCGGSLIVMTTSCVDDGPDDPARSYCYAQQLAFVSSRVSAATRTYRYSEDGGNQHLFVDMSCVEVTTPKWIKPRQVLVLGGTNSGMCTDGCEWEDLYLPSGKYLGSTKEITEYPVRNGRWAHTTSTVLHRAIPLEYKTAVEGTARELSSVQISYVLKADAK